MKSENVAIIGLAIVVVALFFVVAYQNNEIKELEYNNQKAQWYVLKGLEDYTVIPNEFMSVPLQNNTNNLTDGLNFVIGTKTPNYKTWINKIKMHNPFEEFEYISRNWGCDICRYFNNSNRN